MNGLTVYVVCPKCALICIDPVTPLCCLVVYSQRRGRAACGATLMKKVKSRAAHNLVPVKTFLYNGVVEALKGFVQRNGFLQQCNAWKEHTQSDSVLSDVMVSTRHRHYAPRVSHYFSTTPFLLSFFCFILFLYWRILLPIFVLFSYCIYVVLVSCHSPILLLFVCCMLCVICYLEHGHLVCGESWLAVKDSLTHHPSSQGWAPRVLLLCCCVLCCVVCYCVVCCIVEMEVGISFYSFFDFLLAGML